MRSYSAAALAHLFGIIAIILMLVWLLHYREGIEYDSDNALRVFNVHPFVMFFGFIFLVGQASIHGLALAPLLVWLAVAFWTYFHAWISSIKGSAVAPWHIAGGSRALFYMAICAALTGLMEKYTMLRCCHTRENLI
ncbi:Cytochrome b561/ferric reductase transmembrane [Sesbania bispinosa]|nr:Cytochrome b561/ferric reductase transmembrane [Sesbania bispinosa]